MRAKRYRNDAGKGLPAYETLRCPVDAGKGLPAHEIMESRVGRHSHAAVSLTLASRRAFILAAAAWPALAWMGAAFGQSKKPPVVIGWLNSGSRTRGGRSLPAFKEGMAALGWKEGSNYVLEERWAEGRGDRLRTLAEELAARKPEVIVAAVGNATAAAARAAPKTPIVQANGNSPVSFGLAASLARPGSMVTGVTNIITEISEKYLELLLAAAPKLKRVGFLVDRGVGAYATHMKNARRAIEHYRVEARFAEVAKAEDLDPAIARLAKEGVEGLVMVPSPGLFGAERRRIVKLALAQRWPVIAGGSRYAEDGALLSYGADPLANFRRAAYYVNRILKGAKPGDLPIEQPTKFELVINMKTARALGITIPQEMLLRADRVIE
ncbi:MAG: ABC transporter substrate-binding protein [Betaproteobacteria bacterium]|nr:ABC transporter substrate-binding protein [Betaproteobacteria bacterium]